MRKIVRTHKFHVYRGFDKYQSIYASVDILDEYIGCFDESTDKYFGERVVTYIDNVSTNISIDNNFLILWIKLSVNLPIHTLVILLINRYDEFLTNFHIFLDVSTKPSINYHLVLNS